MISIPTPDFAASVAFLKMALPLGQWQLTAIDPEKKKPPVTRTFYPGQEQALLDWLDLYNGRNLYWAVNPPALDANKKSEKKDIKQVGYLHADLDPEDKLPLQQAQAKIRKNFEMLPIGENKHPPSFIIFSGNGYQAFWKLAKPVAVNSDPTLIERYNIQRAKMFGGDNCHNIDRILRLPGTVNWPNERKRQKGRVPVLATMYAVADPMPAYPLGLFTPAPEEVQSPASPWPTVSIDASNVVRLGDISKLDKWGVSDRVKVICVQGKHPDEPKVGDNSRSAWLYDAVCNMVRAGVPDEMIYAIITDPEFGISASVLDKSNSAKYAIKQIEDAHKEASLPDWLVKMNSEYAYIGQVGGKQRILWQDGKRNIFMVKGDVKEFLVNRPYVKVPKPDGTEGKSELFEAWRRSPFRREYATVEFAPGITLPPGIFNTWLGWKIGPPPEGASCNKFVDFILKIICNSNDEHFQWFISWIAHMIQKPHERSEVAVVLKGGEGIGWVSCQNVSETSLGTNTTPKSATARTYLATSTPRWPIPCCCFAMSCSPVATKRTKRR